MNIYTVYDLQLNYYQQPFIGQNDKQVLSALAIAINSGDPQHAYAQAPQDFELWEIGSIEDAHITNTKKRICTLDTLVRRSLRPNADPSERASPKMDRTTGQGQRNPEIPTGTGTKHPAPNTPATPAHWPDQVPHSTTR